MSEIDTTKRRFEIRHTCNQCKVCLPACPVDSILLGIDRYVIDSDTCTGCGMCARICSENAVVEISEKLGRK